jgi:polyisoprenoid-binding protein YceI
MKTIQTILIALFLTITASSVSAAARSWDLDTAHSNIYFGVTHIFSKVNGLFNNFSLELNFDPENLEQSSFLFTIEVESINTNIAKRDKHLVSADFFDAGKFPQMIFQSTAITGGADDLYNVAGTLTIKGVDYDVTLPLKLEGITEHPTKKGTDVAGFNGTLTIDRLAYGVGTGKFYEMGVVDKMVDIFVSLEVLSDK